MVDNDSADDSLMIARLYGVQTISSATNVGFGAAVNLALAHRPSGADVLLVNPDCTVDTECVTALRRCLETQDDLGIVAPAMRYPDGSFGISGGSQPMIVKEWLAAGGIDRVIPRSLLARVVRALGSSAPLGLAQYLGSAVDGVVHPTTWASGFCLLVRGAVVDEIVGFDDRYFMYFEDVDLCLRAGALGWKVAIDGRSAAGHAESASSQRVGKSRLYYDGLVTYALLHKGFLSGASARLLRRIAG